MKKILLTIALFLAGGHFAFAATYYIDYVGGSDSNNGTSTSTPWKRQPYMTGFTGSYSHSSGDQFIFKGGTTWASSTLPISIPFPDGGASTTPDYYGVNKTWYSGGSWTQPTFDAQSTCIGVATTTCGGNFVNLGENNYVTLDNLHFTNYYWQGPVGNSFGSAVMFQANDTLGFVLENSTIDNWSHDTYAHCGSVSAECDNAIGVFMGSGTNFIINSNLFTQCYASSTCGDSLQQGAVYQGVNGLIENNTCFNIEGCLIPAGGTTIRNNLIYQSAMVNDYDPGAHTDLIYEQGGNANIYGNTIHDVNGYGVNPTSRAFVIDYNACEGETSNIYNNLIYNQGTQTPITVDDNLCSNGSNGTGVSNIWNNTIVPGTGVNCVRVVERWVTDTYGTIDLRNTHCITSNSLYGLDSGVTVNTLATSSTLVQSTTTAAATGYTNATVNPYSPSTASSPTVGMGANLTSAGVFTTDFLGVPRPASGAWDIGAYQFVTNIATAIGNGMVSFIGMITVQ